MNSCLRYANDVGAVGLRACCEPFQVIVWQQAVWKRPAEYFSDAYCSGNGPSTHDIRLQALRYRGIAMAKNETCHASDGALSSDCAIAAVLADVPD